MKRKNTLFNLHVGRHFKNKALSSLRRVKKVFRTLNRTQYETLHCHCQREATFQLDNKTVVMFVIWTRQEDIKRNQTEGLLGGKNEGYF